jgi:mannitol 2-dehydrogenase
LFAAVAGEPEAPGHVALDSSHVKIHRCASGGKGGPRRRRSASPKAAATAKSMRLSMRSAGHGPSY